MNKQIRESIRRSMRTENNTAMSFREKEEQREKKAAIMHIKDPAKRLAEIQKNHDLFGYDPDAARRELASWKNGF